MRNRRQMYPPVALPPDVWDGRVPSGDRPDVLCIVASRVTKTRAVWPSIVVKLVSLSSLSLGGQSAENTVYSPVQNGGVQGRESGSFL